MKTHKSYTISELSVGMTSHFSKALTQSEVIAFAQVSGDDNPVHLDESYASQTMFKRCIAHGMLTGSLISTIIGTQLPGNGSIYLSQSLRFKAPVMVGDLVEASVEITDLDRERKRIVLSCVCKVADKVVLDGEARVMVPAG